MLKFFIVTLLFVIPQISSGQKNHRYLLCNRADSTKIDFAHIFLDNKLHTYSNENGMFEINSKFSCDSIKIEHLSFKTLKLSYDEFSKKNIFFLEESSIQLEEFLIITSKKKKKSGSILLPEKSPRDLFMNKVDLRFPYQAKIAVFVPNNKKNNLTIKNIIFQARGEAANTDNKYIPFKVNLMTVDNNTNGPKDYYFSNDLPVGKKENQNILKVNISDLIEIKFPNEGIFIVVSLYSEEYYKKNGYEERPGFATTQITKGSNFREYLGMMRRDGFTWSEASYSQDRIQCFSFGIELE